MTALESEHLPETVDSLRNDRYQLRSHGRQEIEALATDIEGRRPRQPDLFEAIRDPLER